MRPLQAHIDLDALRHNYRLACECAPCADAMAVLKADAYGHGAIACARALAPLAPAMALASLEEGRALRVAGIDCPLVLLEGFFEADEIDEAVDNGYWCVLHSHWQVEALLAALQAHPGRCPPVLVKCDSGMHRLGFFPDEARAVCQRLMAHPEIGRCTLMTHFATADTADDSQFRHQMAVVEALRDGLGLPTCFANSPATLSAPRSHGEWVRPGIMLYGANPLERDHPDHARFEAQLRPVMTLESRIIAVRELGAGEPVGYGARFVTERPTRVGVVACGYGDGYDRHAPDGTPVLVNGRRTRLIGRISMDMLTVDLSDIADADVGARVTLWGQDTSGARLPVDEVARWCDTIAYTLLTGVLPRVPRRYYHHHDDHHHDDEHGGDDPTRTDA